jgi:hypothetical protein
MKSSERLHSWSVVRFVQSILFVAVVLALAVVVSEMYQQRRGERAPAAPGTERTAPKGYTDLIEAFV